MWRYVGRHTHRNTRRTIDKQIGYAGGQYSRLCLGIVVVGGEVNGAFIQICKQLVRDARHTHFGVTHCCRRVTIDRTKVTLPVNQHVAHRERLRHTDNSVVNCRVTVRMVFTDNITDHAG